MWKLSLIAVQVTGLVTTPGGSFGGDQVLCKLPGVVVQVAGLVTTPGRSWDRYKVLWKGGGVDPNPKLLRHCFAQK